VWSALVGAKCLPGRPKLTVHLEQFNFSCSLSACCGFGWRHQNDSPYINIAAYSSLPALSSRRHKAEQKILKCSKPRHQPPGFQFFVIKKGRAQGPAFENTINQHLTGTDHSIADSISQAENHLAT
jgi:hypothetical protein